MQLTNTDNAREKKREKIDITIEIILFLVCLFPRHSHITNDTIIHDITFNDTIILQYNVTHSDVNNGIESNITLHAHSI